MSAFSKVVKNFRFWILIGGMVFFVAGLVMRKFGINPCPPLFFPGKTAPMICDYWGTYTVGHYVYLLGEPVMFFGGILFLIGIILFLAQFSSRFIENASKRKTSNE